MDNELFSFYKLVCRRDRDWIVLHEKIQIRNWIKLSRQP